MRRPPQRPSLLAITSQVSHSFMRYTRSHGSAHSSFSLDVGVAATPIPHPNPISLYTTIMCPHYVEIHNKPADCVISTRENDLLVSLLYLSQYSRRRVLLPLCHLSDDSFFLVVSCYLSRGSMWYINLSTSQLFSAG